MSSDIISNINIISIMMMIRIIYYSSGIIVRDTSILFIWNFGSVIKFIIDPA